MRISYIYDPSRQSRSLGRYTVGGGGKDSFFYFVTASLPRKKEYLNILTTATILFALRQRTINIITALTYTYTKVIYIIMLK